jgi:DNA-directed RNA polymerase specialized sigma24 family protein
MHEEEPRRFRADGDVRPVDVRAVAVRASRRRLFSDLAPGEREELVSDAVDAYDSAFGPVGRPRDLEAWLAMGMYRLMMDDFRTGRMLRPSVRPAGTPELTTLLGEWISTEPDHAGVVVDETTMDRFVRQLSPADARLLWLTATGYTREEIGDVLGTRPNAVSVRLHRLRIRLRETLEPVLDQGAVAGAGDAAGRDEEWRRGSSAS